MQMRIICILLLAGDLVGCDPIVFRTLEIQRKAVSPSSHAEVISHVERELQNLGYVPWGQHYYDATQTLEFVYLSPATQGVDCRVHVNNRTGSIIIRFGKHSFGEDPQMAQTVKRLREKLSRAYGPSNISVLGEKVSS